MLSPKERLEQLEKVLDELEDLSISVPIIVEGIRDKEALRRLGITRNVIALNRGKSVFTFSEEIAKRHRRAIVMTDWDRRGGMLARMLKEALMANGVEAIDHIRMQIVILSKKEVKDIESMPTYLERLKTADTLQRRACLVRAKDI